MKQDKNIITVSAPGKLMLFGEHAVVYNRPSLVTAVNQRLSVTITVTPELEFILKAPDVKITHYKKLLKDIGKGDVPKGARFVEMAIKNFAEKYGLKKGLIVTTNSSFSSRFGFGSSSASTVCVIKALSELTGKKLSQKQLFEIAYKTVLDIQRKGSGVDVAAAIYGGTIYFVTGGKVIKPLKMNSLPLIVGYTGVKADTVPLMNMVKEKADKYPKVIEDIYDSIETLVEMAKKALLKNDWQKVGELMDIHQGYLASLGVSTQKLADIIYAVRSAGGYGAKLSGAGGGDCMIALSSEKNITAVKKAITSAGGQVIDIETNAEGVRIEK